MSRRDSSGVVMRAFFTLLLIRHGSFRQTFVSKQAPETMVDEDELGPLFCRHDKAGFFQRAQIFRRGQPLGDAGFFNETDLAIGLLEDQLDQFLAEDCFRQGAFRLLDSFGEQIANGVDFLGGAVSGGLDRFEHVEQPFFPFAAFRDRTKAAVVLRFMFDDETAQKQDRDLEQPVHDQLQNDQDPSGASVAIEEWVDGFELVMRHADPNERIDLGGSVVREALEVSQLLPKQLFAFRRRVDDFLGGGSLEFCSGQIANAGAVLLDDIDELDGQIGGKKRPLPNDIHAMPESVAIMEDLLGVGRKVGPFPLSREAAIEFVVGGENVLDFGAEFRFLKREGVEKNGGIGDAMGAAL